MSILELHAFGRTCLVNDEVEIPLGSKALALLAYLAAGSDPSSKRDEIAQLLWPADDPKAFASVSERLKRAASPDARLPSVLSLHQ